jgi:pyrroline-5-carboxylate reductase
MSDFYSTYEALKDVGKRIGIVGCGNMGGAIAKALIDAGVPVRLFDADQSKASALAMTSKTRAVKSVAELIDDSDTVVLAVKPQMMDSVATAQLRDKKVITIAAGLPTSYFERMIGGEISVVRVMPNLPAKVGKSVSALCKGAHATDEDLAAAKDIFDKVGCTLIVDECDIDKVTAVSGSGPGYIYALLDSFEKAAMSLGFSKAQAHTLVLGTVRGAVALIDDTDEFDALRAAVCSKGGTTEAGITALTDAKTDATFCDVVARAAKRAKELSK